LIEQEKKSRKKKSRLEKSVEEEEEEEDNDDIEFIINKFDDEEDFISFENENEKNENVSHAKNAKHDNLRTNHSIDDEFNSKNFFDDMNDERAFETLYS
jgi:hypothetical protein